MQSMLGCKMWLKLPEFLGFSRRLVHIKRAELYEKCYQILGVENSADQNTVRRAYIALVKQVHPDSGQPEACAERFQEVDQAFKLLQSKFAKNRRGIHEDDEEQVFDIKHTAPQHRQYLSYDGVGIGNPYQRQKQYQQVRAMKAQERVLKHRVDKAQAGEGSLMQKGSFYKSHAIKTKYGIERVVEDLIQEAMSKGDFNNLSGSGKPLSSAQTQNPYIDFTTHKLNKILLDNGFTPEWITLQREIRTGVQQLKQRIREERAFFGDWPFKQPEATEWELMLQRCFEQDVKQLNRQIDKFNLIVPILDNQMFRLNLETLAEYIVSDESLPKNYKRQSTCDPATAATTAAATAEPNGQKKDLFSFIGSLF